MADRVIEVLTAASSFELLTLQEAKMMIGLSLSDSTYDAQMQLFTDINSAVVMRLCNRIFAREKVRESWSEINNNRIFLSHWPVSPQDIESVESPEGTATLGYKLEPASGKISGVGAEPIVVTYTGGYELPGQAPLPLKQAVALLNKKSYTDARMATSAAASGVRMLAHRDSRVMYHDPSRLAVAQATAAKSGGGGIDQSVLAILYHYMHQEV
jgi:hypothetical protein